MGRHIFLAVNNSSPILFTQIVIMNEAKDGTTRMSLDVSADEVEFLTPKGDDQGSSYSAPTAPRPQQNRNQDVAGFTDISSDDIPF